MSRLSFAIAAGIDHFTAEHALVIAGVVRLYFDKVNPAAAELEASAIEEAINPKPQQSIEDKQRTLLKQKLYLSKNTYYEYEEDDDRANDEEDGGISEARQTYWIDDVILGLARHATFARQRVVELRDRLKHLSPGKEHGVLILLLRKSIDSFCNCTRCLVHIGEASLRRLPNNPRVVGFCSRLVLCLTQLFIDSNKDYYDYYQTDERTYLKAGRSLIDADRYTDSILDATKKYQQRHFPAMSSLEGHDAAVKEAIEAADCFLQTPPDNDVQDLIWCLFSMDLVETSISRCGYGDIQVWLGLPITPLDPLLFYNGCNSPSDEVLEDAWAWETDEVCTAISASLHLHFHIIGLTKLLQFHLIKGGNKLYDDRLNARYDFSLVLLLCAWNAPWSVESHHSFQEPFRKTVRTLFLCANRVHMPTDIALHVCKFLRRDWWPDERAQCFSEECLAKRASKLVHQKLIHGVTGTLPKRRVQKFYTFCPGCSVAWYCCEDHRQSDYRDGHKALCGKPPYRIPGQQERELLNDVLCLQQRLPSPLILNEKTERLIESQLQCTIGTEDDGSGSWESIDSEAEVEEEASDLITDVIHKFFERECYRRQRSEQE